MSSLVELDKITKSYPNKTVLSSVSLAVHTGKTHILLGTNGSGKSTLIKIIGGFIHPTSGRRIVNESMPPIISYMPDRFPKHKFTSEEYLMHMGCIQGIKKDVLKQRIKEWHDLFHLPLSNQPMRYFSKGMLQKVNMMQAMMSKPDLLLLDEPLSGLDVASMLEMVGALNELKKQNVTIVISTHETEMLQKITDRVITVQQGSLIEQEKKEILKTESKRIICRLDEAELIHQFSSHFGVLSAETLDGLTHFDVREDCCDSLLLGILQAGGSIIQVAQQGGQ